MFTKMFEENLRVGRQRVVMSAPPRPALDVGHHRFEFLGLDWSAKVLLNSQSARQRCHGLKSWRANITLSVNFTFCGKSLLSEALPRHFRHSPWQNW